MTDDLGYAESRAVLIGVSAYEDSSFPPVRAARNSLKAMREMLEDPLLCGWPRGRITEISNPLSPVDLANQLSDLAESTTGVLLLYFVGHGVLTPRGELCLTVTSTNAARPKITSLPWETVAEILHISNCPARVRVAILDCCFAGQPIPETLGGDVVAEGVYTLTATTRNKTAHVVAAPFQEDACTSFTAELLALVNEGVPDRSAWLSLSELYPVLRHRLQRKGLPLPNQHGTDTADKFLFTANAAHPSHEARGHTAAPEHSSGRETPYYLPEPDRREHTRPSTAELDTAVLSSYSLPPGTPERSIALAGVAEVLAATDPKRSARLFAQAEEVAQSIVSLDERARTLAAIAQLLSASDPEHAERFFWQAEEVARSHRSPKVQVRVLGAVAQLLSVSDPEHAERFFGQAEEIAQSIRGKNGRARALIAGATALATANPARAERIARSFRVAYDRSHALAAVAAALAIAHPDEAQRIAWSIRNVSEQRTALIAVAKALAAHDPQRAERIAQSVGGTYEHADALAAVARALAAHDPDRAERIAQSLDADRRRNLLVLVAGSLAVSAPDRAEDIAHSIGRDPARSMALALVAKKVAAIAPDRAERIAQAIPDGPWKVLRTTQVAMALAGTHPEHARRLFSQAEDVARSIPRQYEQSQALLALVEGMALSDPSHAEVIAQSLRNRYLRSQALEVIAKKRPPARTQNLQRTAPGLSAGPRGVS